MVVFIPTNHYTCWFLYLSTFNQGGGNSSMESSGAMIGWNEHLNTLCPLWHMIGRPWPITWSQMEIRWIVIVTELDTEPPLDPSLKGQWGFTGWIIRIAAAVQCPVPGFVARPLPGHHSCTAGPRAVWPLWPFWPLPMDRPRTMVPEPYTLSPPTPLRKRERRREGEGER